MMSPVKANVSDCAFSAGAAFALSATVESTAADAGAAVCADELPHAAIDAAKQPQTIVLTNKWKCFIAKSF